MVGLCGQALPADLADRDAAELLSIYQQLRSVALDPNRIAIVEKVELRKDVATFQLDSGELYLLQPMGGEVVGAVFLGKGVLHLKPSTAQEQRQLARFNGGKSELDEPFERAVLWFSDDTFAELDKVLKPRPGPVPAAAQEQLYSFRKKMREKLLNNVEAQLLETLTHRELPYFLADIQGERHGQLLFELDMHLAEQLRLTRYVPGQFSEVWVSARTKAGAAEPRDAGDMDNVVLDVTIDKGARIKAKGRLEFTAAMDGPRMVKLDLAPSLRVKQLTDSSGHALVFIQEDEKKDADLWVILPARLSKGDKLCWDFVYEGGDVVQNAGSGNYYVGQRTRWYPRLAASGGEFTDRAAHRMTFRIPKQYTLAATGKLVKSYVEKEQAISEWESGAPLLVAGFNYGDYKTKSVKNDDYEASVYTNPGLNDELGELQILLDRYPQAATALGITPSGFNTTRMAQAAGAEAVNAMKLFAFYFGEPPYKSISVTQQPAGFFGQSWPTLIFLPYTAFLDSTIKHQLRLTTSIRGREFFEEVGSHEIAHQWWGHMVAYKSYHDVWLSEGFAQFSAGLFLHRTQGEKKFREFIETERDFLRSPQLSGQRLNDVGPVWMGDRLFSEKTPGAYRLVYTKGGYALHMLRMYFYDLAHDNDSRFINMMRDFVATYAGKSASTADFKAIVDKHAGTDMSWFFNQWIYGTEMPDLHVKYGVSTEGAETVLNVEMLQRGASPGFRTVLPFRMKTEKGWASGKVVAEGEVSKVRLTIPGKPSSLEFDPLHAVPGDLKGTKD